MNFIFIFRVISMKWSDSSFGIQTYTVHLCTDDLSSEKSPPRVSSQDSNRVYLAEVRQANHRATQHPQRLNY
jgi:hypothetical protein